MRSARSTNIYSVLIEEIEEKLNSQDKEHAFFDAVLVLDNKENYKEHLLKNRNTLNNICLNTSKESSTHKQDRNLILHQHHMKTI